MSATVSLQTLIFYYLAEVHNKLLYLVNLTVKSLVMMITQIVGLRFSAIFNTVDGMFEKVFLLIAASIKVVIFLSGHRVD